MNHLQGKQILLGVTGSIAVYRSLDLIRLLQAKGAEVKVIMTKGAQAFITPLTFSAISRNKVYTDIFQTYPEYPIVHLDLAKWADALVIAPASADILAKLAQGIADDLLTSTFLGCSKPVLIAPSMNPQMYAHPAVQANIARLKSYGFHILASTQGKTACGDVGQGRLPPVENMVEAIEFLFSKKDLTAYKVLITAGPTQEAIDPIRFITNRSSSRMGFALAKTAYQRGAKVTLISGPTSLKPPYGVNFLSVTTTQDMLEAVLRHFPFVDVVVMAAAVMDFKPLYHPHKIKKREKLSLSLEKTPDILAILGKEKKHQYLIGFAAETKDLLAEAMKKLNAKNLDMIVANEISQSNTGFKATTNKVSVIYKNGAYEQWPLMSKEDVAWRLWDRIKTFL